MIPLIEAEIVDRKKWISKEDFLDLMALARTVPGIFAVNIAIFIGYKIRKFWGAFWMATGTILPSFAIILLIALFFQQFKHLPAVESIFKGIRPAVVALIAAPTFKMAQSARINRYNLWIPVVSALLIWLLDFSPSMSSYSADWEDTCTDAIKTKNIRRYDFLTIILYIFQDRTLRIRRRICDAVHDSGRGRYPAQLALVF